MARKKVIRKTGPREKLIASGSDESKFTVLVDSAEQNPQRFIKTDYCNGSTTSNLLWGDYTLLGLEDKFILERKGSVSELYSNICGDDWIRFEKELIALRDYPDAFLLFEFSMNDVLKFPWNQKLPMAVKRKIGNRGGYFLRRLLEVCLEHRIPILWAGSSENAKVIMISLFKRIWAKYGR